MNIAVEVKNHENKLPAAVIRNAKAADDMQQELINPTDPNAAPGDPNAPPPEPPVEPLVPPAGQPSPEPPAPPVTEPDDDSWKHKYQSMQGRFNAETGKLRGQIDALMGQVANLNKVLASVNHPEPETGFTRPTAQAAPLISDEERAEYGEDFVHFASRLAAQEANKATQPLLQEIEGLKKQMGGVGQSLAQRAREQMFADMDEAVPEWREINNSPEFNEWLNLQDAYTGAIRRNILDDASKQNNFPRVQAFFRGFLAELAATVAPQSGEPENKGTVVPKIALNNIVAPGRAKSAAATPPPAPPEKPVYKPSFVTQFFNDKIAGRYKGREADAVALEADIILAGNEGRIRQ